MPTDRPPLGENVKRLREARGLSPDELAEAAKLSRQGLWLIETGRSNPRIDTIQRLATVLGVGVGDLYLPAGAARKLPAALEQMIKMLEGQEGGMAKPTEAEIDELLAVRLRGAPTAKSYLFLLMALRETKR